MFQSAEEALKEKFPELRNCAIRVTSEFDTKYNCVAWAARDHLHIWDIDDGCWPPGASPEFTIKGYMSVFATLGYAECSSSELEASFEKIAIFEDRYREPSHVARQTVNGLWTSKLGIMWDVEHDLQGLEGERYGKAKLFMKRPIVDKE